MRNGWRYLAVVLSFGMLSNGQAKITNAEITNDQSYIYFKFRESLSFSYYHVYIDSDNNSNTGFKLQSIGADRLLENNSSWKSTGKTWGWTSLGAISFTNLNGMLSWKMPLSLLGAPLQCNTPIKVIFAGEGRAIPSDFSSVINYNLNIGDSCGVITNPTATASDSQFTFSYQVTAPQALYRIYLDTDSNASTGYPIGNIGANYLLIGKSLYSYNNGSWKWLKSIAFTQTGNTVSWTIKRSDLGNKDCAGSIVYLPTIQKNGDKEFLSNNATLNYTANPNCPTPTSSMHIAVPAYFDPCSSNGCDWDLIDTSTPTTELAVFNIDNGPGGTKSSAYTAQVQRSQTAGANVLGYVYSSSGSRPLNQILNDIDAYYSWYNVDGIFIDEASSDCSTQSYYQTIYQYIKSKGGKAIDILNPGTPVPECFASVSDILITYESPSSSYPSWQAADWEAKYPASKFWHIIYNVQESDLSSVINLASQRHVGNIYISNLNLPNPYASLPPATYWNTEVSLVKAAQPQ